MQQTTIVNLLLPLPLIQARSKSNSEAQLASRGEKLTSKIYSGKEDSDDLPFSESAKHPLKPKSKSTSAKLPTKPKSKHKSRPTLTKSCWSPNWIPHQPNSRWSRAWWSKNLTPMPRMECPLANCPGPAWQPKHLPMTHLEWPLANRSMGNMYQKHQQWQRKRKKHQRAKNSINEWKQVKEYQVSGHRKMKRDIRCKGNIWDFCSKSWPPNIWYHRQIW